MFRNHRVRPSQVFLQLEALEERCVLSSSSYITSLYNTLLFRNPSAGEVASWVSVLDSTGSPTLVANAFVDSTEFRQNLVRFDYQVLLQRQPSAQEVATLVNLFQNGLTENELEVSLLASPEFYVKNGNTPQGWLAAVYNDVLGQGPPATLLANPSSSFTSQIGRNMFALNLVQSNTAHTDVVDTDYRQVLQREPDSIGASGWVNVLNTGVDPSQVLVGFVTSPEYIADSTSMAAAEPVQSGPVVTTPFTFNPVLGTSLGGNSVSQSALLL